MLTAGIHWICLWFWLGQPSLMLHQTWWINLKEHFYFPIVLHHKHYLCFAFEGIACQFKVLPFSLSLAPRFFKRCMWVGDASQQYADLPIFGWLAYLCSETGAGETGYCCPSMSCDTVGPYRQLRQNLSDTQPKGDVRWIKTWTPAKCGPSKLHGEKRP